MMTLIMGLTASVFGQRGQNRRFSQDCPGRGMYQWNDMNHPFYRIPDLTDKQKEQFRQPDTVVNESVKDSLAGQIGQYHMELEQSNYNHFSELRELLDDRQKEKFDSIIQQIIRRPGRGLRPRMGSGSGMRRSEPESGGGMF